MKEKRYAYEPMPITAERKAELVAQGYIIRDARFAPVIEREPEPVRRVRRGKAEQA